jgi:hypothetical protein
VQSDKRNNPIKLGWLRIFIWLYFTIIFAWAIAHPFLRDYPWWLFAVNALAFYDSNYG